MFFGERSLIYNIGIVFYSSGVVYQNSHLLAGHVGRNRYNSSTEEEVKVTTTPNKWPGKFQN